MKTMQLKTNNREQTISLGRLIGLSLPPGTVVCLEGDLGAGKTALTVGLAKGLGIRRPVSSPTFTLLIEHEAGERGIPLYHFDVYRLADGESFLELGFEEYIGDKGICVIEWSSRVRDVLPAASLEIELRFAGPDQPDARELKLSWQGHEDWLTKLAADWAGGADSSIKAKEEK